MKIRHPKGGEVDGVIESGEKPGWWVKTEGYSMRYFDSGDGWSEVTEPKYVDVTWECEIIPNGDMILGFGGDLVELPDGHSFRKKYWSDLPENLLHEIHHLTAKWFVDYVQRYKKPCLIVEKEEG